MWRCGEKAISWNNLIELLNDARIIAAMTPASRALMQNLLILPQIDSTNRYLMDLGKQQQSGVVCFAEQQTAGKGRRGRHWVSPFGNNIYLSVLWRYELAGPDRLAGLSLAVAVAVIRALTRLGVENVGIKWPNDLVSQQKNWRAYSLKCPAKLPDLAMR